MAEPCEKRPSAANHDTAQNRYKRIRDAFGQYNKAMENGYYVECVALLDSAITDRLESLYNYIEKPNKYVHWSAKCYDRILKNSMVPKDIISEIEVYKGWSSDRNEAVHGMFKISETDQTENFKDIYGRMKKVAEDGYEIFRKLDEAMKRFRSQEENNNLVVNKK